MSTVNLLYKPRNGHFISKDPDTGDLDDLLSQNGYTYANNNPMAHIDPDGSRGLRFGGGIRFRAPRLRIPRIRIVRIRAARVSSLGVGAAIGGQGGGLKKLNQVVRTAKAFARSPGKFIKENGFLPERALV